MSRSDPTPDQPGPGGQSPLSDEHRLNLAGIIYGVILATALISVYGEERFGPAVVCVGVIGTAAIFWLTHAYAQLLAAGLATPGAITRQAVRESVVREFPIVIGAAPPALVLLAAPIGLLSESAAETTAILLGLALLATFGVIVSRRQGQGPLGTLVLTALSVALGLAVVGLKALIH